jgi:hypothetical protein
MSAAAGPSPPPSGRDVYERLPEAKKRQVQLLLQRRKLFQERVQHTRPLLEQVQTQLDRLSAIEAHWRARYASANRGVRERGRPVNYGNLGDAQERMADVEKARVPLEALRATHQGTIDTLTAQIAEINASLRAIVGSSGGRRQTRRRRTHRRGTRKHR